MASLSANFKLQTTHRANAGGRHTFNAPLKVFLTFCLATSSREKFSGDGQILLGSYASPTGIQLMTVGERKTIVQ